MFARLRLVRRGLARPARALAAAALLALSGALALPAAAQAQEISLVSNIGQGHNTNLNINPPDFEQFGVEIGENRGTQRFTTGPNEAGYTLQSVVLNLHTNRGTGSVVQVAIHDNASSGNPGTLLVVLDNPADPIGNNTGTAGNRTFSAPNPLSLDADTHYWVMVSNTTTNNETNFDVSLTNSNNETGAHGFSIRNSRHQGTPGSWLESSTSKLRMDVRGTVVIPPTEVTLHLSEDKALEDYQNIAVTATVAPATPVAFTVEISASPVAPATDDDFTLSTNRTLSFAANATESTGTVTLSTVTDNVPEPPDVVTVSGAVSNAAIPDPDDVTFTIVNDDSEAFDIAVSAPETVDENAGTLAVTYTLTKQGSAPVAHTDLYYSAQHRGDVEETATLGVDYTAPSGTVFSLGRLVLLETVLPSAFSRNAAGTAWVAQRSLEIGIVDDEEAEVHETIIFRVEAGARSSPTQTITIRDDDTYITSVVVASEPQSGDTYRLHETIVFTVSFSVPVELKPQGRLRLKVGLDNPGGGSGNSVEAVFSRLTREQYPTADTPQISRARHMHFEYKVKSFDRDADGVRIRSNALRLASGARIQNGEVGGDARLDHGGVGPFSDHKVDARADVPRIEDIGVVSTPRLRWRNSREADTYGEGENIRIEVRFDQPVQVEGEPTMALAVGDPCGSVCEARYESGSGTDTLVFAYLVLDVDFDRNGIAIPANPVEVVSGDSIRNDAGDEAHLSFRREGTQSGHKVDGSRAAGPYLSVEDAEAHEADRKMDFTVRLEPHGLGIVTVDYRTRNGSARAGSDYTQTRGTLRFNSLEMERTVSVPIIDDAHEDDGETFTLRLSNPEGAGLEDGDDEATGTIRNSDPLTAAFPASAFASSSHSGAADRPQAVVAFSEPVAAFAADTPSVSVTGGAVASVQPHAEDGLENAWVFFLVPDGGGDVTFALLADAACAAGGICTAGGRTLMVVPAAATIPGPGGPAEPAGPALTASFEGVPSEHDGESAFTFRVAFSEDIGISFRSLREDAFTVTGGRVTGGKRVDDRRDLFRMTVRPDSDADVTITLPAGRDCTVSGAICTKGENRRQLTNTPSATVAGPADDGPEPNTPATGAPEIAGTPRVGDDLTASTSDISDADGLDDASFAYQWIRGDRDISGATRSTYTAVAADEGERLKVRVSFTDDAGNEESLTSAATDAVAARPEPLTASFENMPSEHDGESAFTFRIASSDRLSMMNGRRLREDVVEVSGGRAVSAGRVDRRRDLWRVRIRAGLVGGSDGDGRGGGGLRHPGGGLHVGRPGAVELHLGDGAGTGGHLGGGCARGGGRRRGAGLRGDAQPRGEPRVDGGLRHVGRQRAGRASTTRRRAGR